MNVKKKKKKKKIEGYLQFYFNKTIFAFLSRHAYQSLYYAIFKFANKFSMIKLLHKSYCLSISSIK